MFLSLMFTIEVSSKELSPLAALAEELTVGDSSIVVQYANGVGGLIGVVGTQLPHGLSSGYADVADLARAKHAMSDGDSWFCRGRAVGTILSS